MRTDAQIAASRRNGIRGGQANIKPSVTVQCRQCGCDIVVKPGRAPRKKFCSVSCSLKFRQTNPEVRAKISAYAQSRTAEKHWRWIDDRDYAAAMKRRKQIAGGLVQRIMRLSGTTKITKTEALLGYTRAELYAHLEAQFREGMSWLNYGVGGWEVDHIRPVADFSLDAPIAEINALSNLRPLWAEENSRLGAIFSHQRRLPAGLRNRAIAALGDAVVPAIPEAIGRAMSGA